MEIPIAIGLDPSNFLRRECPTCSREFKWHAGSTSSHPLDYVEPDRYFCPYCGHPADKNSWFTQAQVEYIQSESRGPINELIESELKSAFGKNFNYKSNPAPPAAMIIDPDDMIIVEPPCHSFEPIKVMQDALDELHCLICGARFTT